MTNPKLCLLVLPVFVLGCATIQPREAFPALADELQNRTGSRLAWREGNDADRAVDHAVDDLLGRPLSADAAVQIALLNNRSIQASYEELGIAQAELVEAGLLSNPVFSALLKFPEAGGDPNIELGIAQNFVELLSMPLRKRVASAKYDGVKAKIAGEVVALAFEVRSAFYRLQATEQLLRLHQANLSLAESTSMAAQQLFDAGNISQLQLARHQASSSQAKLHQMQLERDSTHAREKLTTLMGLWGSKARFTLADNLPDLPEREIDFQDIELVALRQSFELQQGVSEIHAARESLGIARRFAWGDLEAGLEAEREGDGQWHFGPGVSVPVPIFNTGAAHVAISRAQLRRAEHRLYALMVHIRSEARSASFELQKARELVQFHQSTLLPLQRNIVHESQLQYNAMQIGVFDLLQARQSELDATSAYIQSLRDYWLARASLERIIGSQVRLDETPTTHPTPGPTHPTSAPIPQNNAPHHHH